MILDILLLEIDGCRNGGHGALKAPFASAKLRRKGTKSARVSRMFVHLRHKSVFRCCDVILQFRDSSGAVRKLIAQKYDGAFAPVRECRLLLACKSQTSA